MGSDSVDNLRKANSIMAMIDTSICLSPPPPPRSPGDTAGHGRRAGDPGEAGVVVA